jgi:hypothetical protein
VRAPLQTDEWEISSDIWRLLAWIIGLLLLVTLLWVITELEIRRDERDQRAIAMVQAEALASSYAIQLANFVEQLDQLSLAVGFGWADAPDRVDLERDRERGLFPVRDHFFVAIIDASGKVVHTTSEPKQRVNLSEAPFFLHHRGQCAPVPLLRAGVKGHWLPPRVRGRQAGAGARPGVAAQQRDEEHHRVL